MRVPGAENAEIGETKLLEYLLSPSHPVGRFKAAFFERHGFTRSNAEALKIELLRIIREAEIVESVNTMYGVKYRVDGELQGPSDTNALIVTIWISADEASGPRVITAYPRD